MLLLGDIFHERNQLLVSARGAWGFTLAVAPRQSRGMQLGDIGMKRILIASAVAFAAGGQALAADLPPSMAPPPRAPAVYLQLERLLYRRQCGRRLEFRRERFGYV
jgi:hypothetical protein